MPPVKRKSTEETMAGKPSLRRDNTLTLASSDGSSPPVSLRSSASMRRTSSKLSVKSSSSVTSIKRKATFVSEGSGIYSSVTALHSGSTVGKTGSFQAASVGDDCDVIPLSSSLSKRRSERRTSAAVGNLFKSVSELKDLIATAPLPNSSLLKRKSSLVKKPSLTKTSLSKRKSSDSDLNMSPDATTNPPLPPGGLLEIAISFDTTGSMYGSLEEIRGRIKDMVQRLQADIPGIRIAIIAHGDYCDAANYIVKWIDFGATIPELCDFVESVDRTSGGDPDECYELVLQRSRKVLTWTPGSQRILVMIGDNAPHDLGYLCNGYINDIDWRVETQELKKMGVKIYSVCVTHPSRKVSAAQAFMDVNLRVRNFYQHIATETGGKVISLDKFGVLFDMIMSICYKESGSDLFGAYEAEVMERDKDKAMDTTLAEMFTTIGSDKGPPLGTRMPLSGPPVPPPYHFAGVDPSRNMPMHMPGFFGTPTSVPSLSGPGIFRPPTTVTTESVTKQNKKTTKSMAISPFGTGLPLPWNPSPFPGFDPSRPITSLPVPGMPGTPTSVPTKPATKRSKKTTKSMAISPFGTGMPLPCHPSPFPGFDPSRPITSLPVPGMPGTPTSVPTKPATKRNKKTTKSTAIYPFGTGLPPPWNPSPFPGFDPSRPITSLPVPGMPGTPTSVPTKPATKRSKKTTKSTAIYPFGTGMPLPCHPSPFPGLNPHIPISSLPEPGLPRTPTSVPTKPATKRSKKTTKSAAIYPFGTGLPLPCHPSPFSGGISLPVPGMSGTPLTATTKSATKRCKKTTKSTAIYPFGTRMPLPCHPSPFSGGISLPVSGMSGTPLTATTKSATKRNKKPTKSTAISPFGTGMLLPGSSPLLTGPGLQMSVANKSAKKQNKTTKKPKKLKTEGKTRGRLNRESLTDAKFKKGPLNQLVWSKWMTGISKTKSVIGSDNHSHRNWCDAFCNTGVLKGKEVCNVPAVYEFAVSLNGKKKVYPVYYKVTTGVPQSSTWFTHLLSQKRVRNVIKDVVNTHADIMVRRGLFKRNRPSFIQKVSEMMFKNYDYAWIGRKERKMKFRNLKRCGVSISSDSY